jgi:membrane-associated phospholipid phosphatase
LDLISRTLAARALSLIGHPALLVPAAVVQGASIRQAPVQVVLVATAVSLLLALVVVVYSLVRVRAGRWSHVDASLPQERTQLNLFAAPLLFVAAAVLWWLGQPQAIVLGLALGGALVVCAHLLRHRLKLSLHAGFAAFSALLLWPSYLGMLSLLLLAVGVAWSRLVLSRHTPQEVALGLLAGATAGLAGIQRFRWLKWASAWCMPTAGEVSRACQPSRRLIDSGERPAATMAPDCSARKAASSKITSTLREVA